MKRTRSGTTRGARRCGSVGAASGRARGLRTAWSAAVVLVCAACSTPAPADRIAGGDPIVTGSGGAGGGTGGAPPLPGELDVGLYWFGPGNVARRAGPVPLDGFYDPARPTLIYTHGWEKDKGGAGLRETFNYASNEPDHGVDVDMADAWIARGWNVGIFYWDQISDEPEVKDAEAKIWTSAGPQGMRWRTRDGSYSTEGAPTRSVAELFVDAYVAALANQRDPTIRLAGHSLGSQLVVRAAALLSDRVAAGDLPERLRPTRIALLDPFWSTGSEDYLDGEWPGAVARSECAALISRGVLFERYKSSGINDLWIGDRNAPLNDLIGVTELDPGYIALTDQVARHIAAPNLYVHSFAYPPPPGCTQDAAGAETCDAFAPSAATPDDVIRAMMTSRFNWKQSVGGATEDPGDNRFTRQAR